MAGLGIRTLSTPDEVAACVLIALRSEPFRTLGWDVARAERALTRPETERYLALDADGAIVGFAVISLRGAFVGYLQTLCVAPEARGRGFGGALLEFVEARLFRESPNVFLCVSGFNLPAREFYRRHGYTLVGELNDYLVPGASELLLRKTAGPIYGHRSREDV